MNSSICLRMKLRKQLTSAAASIALCVGVVLLMFAVPASAQFRQREPNSEYAVRRGRLRAQVDAPIVIFGFTALLKPPIPAVILIG